MVDPSGRLALDPESCSLAEDLPGDGDTGLGCCFKAMEKAVEKYNEFFTRGWRQRHPDCWNAIATAHRRSGWEAPRGDQQILTPLSCMVAGHRGEVMKCNLDAGVRYCGSTDPRNGQTYFGPKVCNRAECPSPFNTLFHERLHRCGAPAESWGLFNDAAEIARRCVGP